MIHVGAVRKWSLWHTYRVKTSFGRMNEHSEIYESVPQWSVFFRPTGVFLFFSRASRRQRYLSWILILRMQQQHLGIHVYIFWTRSLLLHVSFWNNQNSRLYSRVITVRHLLVKLTTCPSLVLILHVTHMKWFSPVTLLFAMKYNP